MRAAEARNKQFGLRQRKVKDRNRAGFIDFQNMIDDYIGSFAFRCEMRNRGLKQSPGSFAIDSGYDDEAWMNSYSANQSSEVTRVLCNDNPVFLDTAFNDAIVWLAPASDVKRMKRIMNSSPV